MRIHRVVGPAAGRSWSALASTALAAFCLGSPALGQWESSPPPPPPPQLEPPPPEPQVYPPAQQPEQPQPPPQQPYTPPAQQYPQPQYPQPQQQPYQQPYPPQQPTYPPPQQPQPPPPVTQPAVPPPAQKPQAQFVAPASEPVTKLTGDLTAGIGGLVDVYPTSHFILVFDASERVFTPIWYGGWIRFNEWLYANEYIPYSFGAEGSFSLGPRPFRFVVIRVQAEHDQSLQLFFRGVASTLPTFEGDIDISDNVVLSYQIAPLEFTATHYDQHLITLGASQAELDAAQSFMWIDPAASFRGRLMLHVKPYPSVHVIAYAEYARQWSTDDQLIRIWGTVGYGILEDAIVFSARIRYDSQQLRFTDVQALSAFYATLQATLRF